MTHRPVWKGMMFVDNGPVTVGPAEAHGQPQGAKRIEGPRPATLQQSRREGHVIPRRDIHRYDVEDQATARPFEEGRPGLAVGLQTPQNSGWRHIEHQHVIRMMGQDAGDVLIADGPRPAADEIPDFGIGAHLALPICVLLENDAADGYLMQA